MAPGEDSAWTQTLARSARLTHSCALCMSASSLLSSFPSFPAHHSLLPLDITAFAGGEVQPPLEAPWDGADGGGSGGPIRHTAWPGL